MMVPSKVILLVALNVLLLGKSLGVAREAREYSSYLPLEDKGPEYHILQYTPNYSFREDYSDCAKNPMIPVLGKGLNILLLKLGAVGLVKVVMAVMFLGMLLKLPLMLLKMTFMKSFLLPLMIAPLLFNLFSNHMSSSSDDDSKPEKPADSNQEMPSMSAGMGGMPAGMGGMSAGMGGMPAGMGGMPAGMGGMSAGMGGMSAGMGGMSAGMGGMSAGMGGMSAGMGGMSAGMGGMPAGMGGMPGGIGGMNTTRRAHMNDMSRSMTDTIMAMGRQMNDNLTTVAWESLKMFAESDQCAEKISCMIGASTKDSSLENIFTRILKYLQYSSPSFLQKRVSRIREAFRKGSRNSTCLQEDYECHSPELLLHEGDTVSALDGSKRVNFTLVAVLNGYFFGGFTLNINQGLTPLCDNRDSPFKRDGQIIPRASYKADKS